jgi:hypothetical protein
MVRDFGQRTICCIGYHRHLILKSFKQLHFLLSKPDFFPTFVSRTQTICFGLKTGSKTKKS